MNKPLNENQTQTESHDEWALPHKQISNESDSEFANDADTEETQETILDMMYPNKEEDEEYPYDDND
jgi:hypothetical protein